MNRTLEGMARASLRIKTPEGFDRSTEHAKLGEVVGMRDALLWLADNVSDEMASAYLECKPTNPRNILNAIRESIAAALRQAAGGEG